MQIMFCEKWLAQVPIHDLGKQGSDSFYVCFVDAFCCVHGRDVSRADTFVVMHSTLIESRLYDSYYNMEYMSVRHTSCLKVLSMNSIMIWSEKSYFCMALNGYLSGRGDGVISTRTQFILGEEVRSLRRPLSLRTLFGQNVWLVSW